MISPNCTTCHITYTGYQCDTSVLDNPIFVIFLIIYQIGFFGIIFLLLLWTIIGGIELYKASGCLKWNFVLILAMNILYCLVQVVHFVDPYGIYLNVSEEISLVVYWIGIGIVCCCCLVCILSWLMVAKGLAKDVHIRLFLYTEVVMICVCIGVGIGFGVVLVIGWLSGSLREVSLVGTGLTILSQLVLVVCIFFLVPIWESWMNDIRHRRHDLMKVWCCFLF